MDVGAVRHRRQVARPPVGDPLGVEDQGERGPKSKASDQALTCLDVVPAPAECSEAFDAVFQAEEMEILNSAPQAPRMNARCECIIGSIRHEALDHVLIMNEAHARHVLAAYEQHDKHRCPHQARNRLPPDVPEQPAAAHDLNQKVLRTRILDGIVNEYRYAA